MTSFLVLGTLLVGVLMGSAVHQGSCFIVNPAQPTKIRPLPQTLRPRAGQAVPKRNHRYLSSVLLSMTTTNQTEAKEELLFPAADDEGNSSEETDVLSASYQEIDFESYFDGVRPDSSWNLAMSNFARQAPTIGTQILAALGLAPNGDDQRPPSALNLQLSNEAVAETERIRIEAGDGVNAHPVSMALYKAGCFVLDSLFDERPIERFWFLETIARIPYFSYVSMLHLYESLGWWRAVELRRVHAAEEWNELHHLLIMESLGGNSVWSDRFLGYHVAILYYWFLILVFLGSPRVAYEFMELLEAHAVDTYATFVKCNRERLAQLPPPKVAVSYYNTGDLYLFDDFQQRPPGSRRPPCDNLLDVFTNICQDEAEHVKTMKACQDYATLGRKVISPHVRYPKDSLEQEVNKKRELWKLWSDEVNEQKENESTEMSGY